MKLLDEIVALLSSKDGSLTDALLKTKVLMHSIGHKELADWVNDELNGYAEGKTVPSYRVIPTRLVGNLRNATWAYANQTLPTAHLTEKQRKHFTENELRESIRVLEELTTKPDMHVTHPVQPEFYELLGQPLQNAWVERAWVQMEPTQIMGVLVEVRSRLLDFVLNLKDELGDVEGADVKEAAKTIDAGGMFANAIFGDNTTIQVGNDNVQKVRNQIEKGDFSSLAAELKKHGIADSDIKELHSAIKLDSTAQELEQKKLGPAVRGWMSTMLGKAVNAAWNIELGIAGGLLTNALQKYYFG